LSNLRNFMNDSNSEKIKRLLFTEEPFDDESFVGYIMRLAELNEIPKLRWILRLVGLDKLYDYKYKYNSDFRVDPEPLSYLAGVSKVKLTNLLYLHERRRRRHIVGNLIVFEQPIQHFFVLRESPKICPLCLTENSYCRKVWELVPVTACPLHQCLLIQNCRSCARSISWSRTRINICHCMFDFRRSDVIGLNSKELRLSQYLYQTFKLPCSFQTPIFKYPLNKLALVDLLSLLFFIASHFAEIPDYNGIWLSKSKSNQEIHNFLCRALEVFDDWAKSYYDLISQWKKPNIRYFINCKQIYLSKVKLPREYSEYELFNQTLHYVLFEPQFSFMHEEFQEYLLRLKSGDFSFQPLLSEEFE
jgi:hypothetical protein